MFLWYCRRVSKLLIFEKKGVQDKGRKRKRKEFDR